jgi:hypothetical protein
LNRLNFEPSQMGLTHAASTVVGPTYQPPPPISPIQACRMSPARAPPVSVEVGPLSAARRLTVEPKTPPYPFPTAWRPPPARPPAAPFKGTRSSSVPPFPHAPFARQVCATLSSPPPCISSITTNRRTVTVLYFGSERRHRPPPR